MSCHFQCGGFGLGQKYLSAFCFFVSSSYTGFCARSPSLAIVRHTFQACVTWAVATKFHWLGQHSNRSCVWSPLCEYSREQGMGAQACDPLTQEAVAGGSPSLRNKQTNKQTKQSLEESCLWDSAICTPSWPEVEQCLHRFQAEAVSKRPGLS